MNGYLQDVEESYICVDGYVIGKFCRGTYEGNEYQYAVRVNWDVWRNAGSMDLPGIDCDLRKETYWRDYDPCMLTQRVPDKRRPDIQELVKRDGVPYYDQFDYMCRHFGLCGNNPLVFIRGVHYYVSSTDGLRLDIWTPDELSRPLALSAQHYWFKACFDRIVTGGYNLREAASRGFEVWLDRIHQIDNDLNIGHPYTFMESLWTLKK